ncbi:MAG: 30S ribosomal protein S17 [Proteobacteria bacterium]|nr:30S ribosomal protein S17 [Pseudomonadota bacterium]NBX85763.1 30S ribosomal protein S17 [Pseudomonadota bacterium]
MPRRILQGTVVSDKSAKTIVVRVESTSKHPLYGKIMRSSKKFHAHDEARSAHMGDIVQIVESKPHSKLKRFELFKVVTVAGAQITDTASDVTA